MANDLTSLISRLEAAEGPSRELDRIIGSAMGYPPQPIDGGVDANIAWMGGLPHFTASIDQALTLVPEGWIVDMGHDAAGSVGALKVIGGSAEVSDGDVTLQGQGRSIPLALCISSLKARAKLSEA
ncbi:hypothetical protein ABNQ39_20700 [Azospirillum sp. A26]|uniref:hypothetical protein n=1 Tax=Azospirillum sp. A26 TaxID=3160607 RepID=UPI00366CDAD0